MGRRRKDEAEEMLGISVPDDVDIVDLEPIIDEGYANNATFDYRVARSNLYHVNEIGIKVLGKLYEEIQTSPTAGKFETVSTLMKSLIEVNQSLLDLTEKRANMHLEGDDEPKMVNESNELLAPGTTADLMRRLIDMQQQASANTA